MPKELTTTQSCRKLGISIDYVYKLIASGKLSARKVDKVWLIPQSEIDARVAQRALRNVL